MPITTRALNRALLARQGLLERMRLPLPGVAERIGALQMQYWPALGPALWSRAHEVAPGSPWHAHSTGDLVTGTLLRGTIHTVTPADYPAYAAVSAASKVGSFRAGPEPEIGELLDLVREMGATPRPVADLVAAIDAWVVANPGVLSGREIELQRLYRWTSVMMRVGFVRVPAEGVWSKRTPLLFALGPVKEFPPLPEALDFVIRRHLGAFGPAAAEDVASWIAWNITPVRTALEAMTDLVTFTDDDGRTLYDLPGAPRPGEDVEAPVRLLPWFDSSLLAYAPGRRTRILPDAHRDHVYVKANGQLKPSFLVDGKVAGLWTMTTAKGGAVTLILTPLEQVPILAKAELVAEAKRLLEFTHPDAASHEVVFRG
ncbi:winged helix DNA-binding domain-containing protein [Herbidospora galbida]|uniref:Winged helix DNA-binding domain-containing protein n=1 Tax=Herbidospora galbida TaxID=2575442 RepID=A0A4U3M5V0_9ACTN|nr:winged helix DNA-binding domain-containing protein [Herbidospora galbida]TKK84265.1 winged helix DNA-binding domain-containing protein [Herbidospora galbida]